MPGAAAPGDNLVLKLAGDVSACVESVIHAAKSRRMNTRFHFIMSEAMSAYSESVSASSRLDGASA